MYWSATIVTLTDCVLECCSSYNCILECHNSYRLYWYATVVTDCVLVCHGGYRLCIGVPWWLQTVYWCAMVVTDCVLVCHGGYRLCIGVPQCVLLHQLLVLQFQNAFNHCWSELLTVPVYTGGPHCDCICFSHHSVLTVTCVDSVCTGGPHCDLIVSCCFSHHSVLTVTCVDSVCTGVSQLMLHHISAITSTLTLTSVDTLLMCWCVTTQLVASATTVHSTLNSHSHSHFWHSHLC